MPVGRIVPDILQILDFYSVEGPEETCTVAHPLIHQMLTRTLITGISFALTIVPAFGAYKDDVRYTELANELNLRGTTVPSGVGVNVTQVEGPEATNAYLPNALNIEFATVNIVDQGGSGLASNHATWVGRNLYGSSTSLTPDIDTIDVHDANDWLNDWRTGTPPIEPNPLQNQSWATWLEDFGLNSSSMTLRMDYASVRDSFLPIVGLYNSDYGSQTIPSDIPGVYGCIYNGITVGVSDGTHRTGVTIYDGAGRVKPEIVAPGRIPGLSSTAQYTSYATPMITSAAALLIDAADSNTSSKKPLTLKAILLAGADKAISVNWDQTTTRPIDDVYGAGELDIYESYFIQQAGQQTVGSSIDERGWNLTTLARRGSDDYDITVPSGFKLRNLSALVTWNRTVSSNFFSTSLANISLTLIDSSSTIQSSDSAVDNIEHIWRDSSNALSAGNYTLTVAHSANSTVDYALAWRSELYQDYSLWSSSVFTANTPVDLRDADDDPDADGIKNLLEQAFGGDPEAQDLDILPISETIEDNGQSYLQISYRKPEFENCLTYTVETVTDLNGTWSSLSSEVELISIVSESGGFDRYTYRLVDPISAADKAFIRVEISETP